MFEGYSHSPITFYFKTAAKFVPAKSVINGLETTAHAIFVREDVIQKPPPQRYCQTTPTISKSAPVRVLTPLLPYNLME
jgi:hypothetical protein